MSREKKWRVVYDTIAGVYIRRVPVYRNGSSCRANGRRHLWVLNSAHRKVCLKCGMHVEVTSYYRFIDEEGLLSHSEIQRTMRQMEASR